MADRNMTEKGFLYKAKGKISAAAFIAQHREWLVSGTLAPLTTPVLAKLEAGELYPTQALNELCKAVMGHMVARQIVEGETKINREPSAGTSGGGGARTTKPYTATVYDEKGNMQSRMTQDSEGAEKDVDLKLGFDCHYKAQGWCDRRLDQGGPGWYALIVDNASGRVIDRIERAASIGRLYSTRPGSGPAMKKMSKESGGLKWKMKAKGDHFHFSKG